MSESKTETIAIDPNYDGMFASLIREIEPMTTALIKEIQQKSTAPGREWTRAEFEEYQNDHISKMLQKLNGLLYPITICAGCMTKAEQIKEFREKLDASLAAINEAFRDTM